MFPEKKKDYPCDLCATDPFVTLILAINTIIPAVTNKKNKNGNNGSALLTLLLPWQGHRGAESIPAAFQQEAAHQLTYTRPFSFTSDILRVTSKNIQETAHRRFEPKTLLLLTTASLCCRQ